MTTEIRTRTVAELIEELEQFDKDALVMFVCDYGDHCHTQQALPVREVEEYTTRDLRDSAYSQSRIALEPRDSDQWFCPECETERATCICSACKTYCVDEEGRCADEDDLEDEDDCNTVVVLRMNGDY